VFNPDQFSVLGLQSMLDRSKTFPIFINDALLAISQMTLDQRNSTQSHRKDLSLNT